MKKTTGIFCLVLMFAAAISAQTFCFQNKGLKAISRISFELEGGKIVEGYYEIIGYDNTTSAETFGFSGAKTGNSLKIKFAGTIPYERPPGTKAIVWTMRGNVLKVPSYGKNHDTNKFSAYAADYENCAGN